MVVSAVELCVAVAGQRAWRAGPGWRFGVSCCAVAPGAAKQRQPLVLLVGALSGRPQGGKCGTQLLWVVLHTDRRESIKAVPWLLQNCDVVVVGWKSD